MFVCHKTSSTCFVSVSVLISPALCLGDNKLGLGSCVATFWEGAAHSVDHVYPS